MPSITEQTGVSLKLLIGAGSLLFVPALGGAVQATLMRSDISHLAEDVSEIRKALTDDRQRLDDHLKDDTIHTAGLNLVRGDIKLLQDQVSHMEKVVDELRVDLRSSQARLLELERGD